MGKALSPAKRGTHGSSSVGSGATAMSGSGAASGTGADELLLTERTERVESTVVSRENATHLAFAGSRTRAFAYAASSQYIHLLNDYCNSSTDLDADSSGASSLLVVVGAPGTGKSSLLAHWAALRRASEDGAHEFIYEHYCGCSFDSVKLSLFLFRLMSQLKITFALRDFELPREHEEEKLKFSFARCLEAAVGRTNQRVGGGGGAASKRRTIVLILDGIDCIRTEDGGDSLSWLPNTFPPGVRIIVSATSSAATRSNSAGLQSARAVARKPVVYDDDGDLIYDTSLPPSDHDSHTVRELRRRRVSFIVVEPLDESSCRAVLQLYNATAGAASSSPLSPSEQDALVAAPGSANPLYLRLILQGQELFGVHEAGARAAWLERATRAREIHQVYELLIRRWNEMLSEDLTEQLHKLTTAAADPETETGGPHKMVRRGTKRDVTATGDPSTTTQSSHGGPHPLTRTPSVRSSSSQPGAPPASDSTELEALHVSMEQRVLLVRHTLSLLAASRYGLSETDLARLLGDAVPRPVCQRLLVLLGPHVMQIRRCDCGDEVVLLDLSHNQLRLLVRYGFLRDDQLRACYYKELATYFGGLEASQRRIDELPVQLERCGLWAALQGALVDIKMFQLWWAERNRQEFFSYWMVLRANCSVHDPVDDFIRSLDEYIVHESPSAEQLLALCLTITDFLRAWQKIDDSRTAQLALARPAPPQLSEFITSLGGFFSTAHLAEHEAKKVQAELDALCIHKDDAYFVRRWLWTQFPLLAVAFECRFLRSLLAGKASPSSSSSSPAPTADASSASAKDDGETSSNASASHSVAASSSTTFAAKKPLVLPRSLDKGASPASPLRAAAAARRKPSLLFGSAKDKDSGAFGSDALGSAASTDDGAFEFLSTENTELSLGSVAKCEAQVMELRVRYDKLKFAAKARRDALATLESRLLDARAQARAAGQSASQVEELLDQIRGIGDETQLGRQRGDYYKAILRHCEIHPARDPNAIEVTELAVNRMKQDIVELQQKTQVASYEARLAGVESKKLHEVIADKTQIHNTALERLRWRFELLQRMMLQQRKAAVGARRDAVDAAKRSLLARGEADDDDNDDDDDDDDEGDDGEDDEGRDAKGRDRRRQSRLGSMVEDEKASQFNRAKDKLLHKKETTLERLRKVESLKVYVGSPFKDDGVLGALRQVGINKPEEAQLYWQDQQQHAAQLEAEEKSLEQRVVDYRDKVASLQTQLLNLKLGGSSSVAGADAGGSASGTVGGSASGPTANAVVASSSGAPSAGSATANGASATEATSGSASGSSGASSSHNLKLLEQQLGDALAVMQQKKERAARVKSLAERLHLGLQHVAHILGVSTTQQMESIELADAVEQVVRLYLGDEGHLQSGSATSLRRKNSVRAMGMGAQSGLHAIAPPDTRSADEKVRFNVRVSKSPQRQMNPYVDGEAVDKDDDMDNDNDNDDDDDDDDDDMASPRRSNQHDTSESVTRRADIKNRSRLELERKLRTPAAKQPRAKTGKTPKTHK